MMVRGLESVALNGGKKRVSHVGFEPTTSSLLDLRSTTELMEHEPNRIAWNGFAANCYLNNHSWDPFDDRSTCEIEQKRTFSLWFNIQGRKKFRIFTLQLSAKSMASSSDPIV